MLQYAIKLIITAVVVVAVAELAKRGSLWGALLAALPLTSLLAMLWLYQDTGDAMRVAALASNILWWVIASLPFFIVLPLMIKNGFTFWPSLGAAIVATFASFLAFMLVLPRFGIKLL